MNKPVYYQSPAQYILRANYYRGKNRLLLPVCTPVSGVCWLRKQNHAFEEGNIVINLIDCKTLKIVWRGIAKGEVNNPESAVNDLPKVITKIIDKLPS